MSNNNYKSDMSIDERVLMALVRVAERYKKHAAAVFKKYELTFPQYNVLRVLDASKDGQNTIKDVKRIMLISSANMTGITKRLEKFGFITRKNAPEDDRLKYLEITDKGRLVLKNIVDKKLKLEQMYLLTYSDEKKAEILKILRELLNITK
ncbi:MAG: MarR family transcriptional regulator [Pseudomonadota bacterium]